MSYKNIGFRNLFVKFLDKSYVLKAFYFRCNIHFYLKGICQVTTHSYLLPFKADIPHLRIIPPLDLGHGPSKQQDAQ